MSYMIVFRYRNGKTERSWV